MDSLTAMAPRCIPLLYGKEKKTIMNKTHAWNLLLLTVTLLLVPPSTGHGTETAGKQPLSLDEAYRLALANHETIRIAGQEVEKSRLLPDKADTIMMPRLNLHGEYVRMDAPIEFEVELGGLVLPPVVTRPEEQKRLNVDLVQPLYQGTWLPRRQQAREAVGRSEEEHARVVQDTLLQVAIAYHEVLKAEKYVAITHQYITRAQEEKKIAEVKFKEGAVTEDVVLSAELKEVEGQTRLMTDTNNLMLARNFLTLLTGIEDDQYLLSEPSPAADAGADVELLFQQALKQRADYRSAQALLAMSRTEVEINKARFHPSLEGSWDYYAVDDPAYDQDDSYWIAAVRLRIPVFEGGIRFLDLAESRKSMDQASLNLLFREKMIRKEIEEAVVAVRTDRALLDSLKKQNELAKKHYEIVLSKFRHGATGSVELNQAMDTHARVKRDMITKKHDLHLALLGLEKATGSFGLDHARQARSQWEQ